MMRSSPPPRQVFSEIGQEPHRGANVRGVEAVEEEEAGRHERACRNLPKLPHAG